jgi:hypothetical protein
MTLADYASRLRLLICSGWGRLINPPYGLLLRSSHCGFKVGTSKQFAMQPFALAAMHT